MKQVALRTLAFYCFIWAESLALGLASAGTWWEGWPCESLYLVLAGCQINHWLAGGENEQTD